ncbi:MAG: transposase [Thioploca sp.]|nr:transposase [Thioploca sp.]
MEIIQSRQVFDLVTPKREVTEHSRGQIECGGLLHREEYPARVTASMQYGPSVRALLTKRSVDHKMPLEQLSQLFKDLYGYNLNTTTMENTLEPAYKLAETLEKQTKVCLLAARAF